MSYALPETGSLVNGTLEYDPASDIISIEAKQIYATWLIGPVTVGSAVQIYLSGITLALSVILWYRKTGRISLENKIYLILANVANSTCMILAMVTFFEYGVNQDRSFESFYSYSTADSLQPFFQGLSGLIVQSFFVRRLQKFLGKLWVAFLLYPLIFIGMSGAILSTLGNFLYTNMLPGGYALLDTGPQMWLWASATTDIAISLILSISLWRNKRGFAQRTEKIVNRVIRFSLGTAAVTTLNAVVGAITYKTFYWDIRCDLYYVFTTPLPSIYLLTLIYACSGWGRESNSPGRSGASLESGVRGGDSSRSFQPPRTPSSGQQTRPDRGDDMQSYVHWSPIAKEAFERNIGPDLTPNEVSFVDLRGFATPALEKTEDGTMGKLGSAFSGADSLPTRGAHEALARGD